MAKLRKTLLISLASIVVVSCGVKMQKTTPNDAPPSAPLLSQGGFSPPVSGTAGIYDLGGGAYQLYLAGLSAPQGSAYIVVNAGGNTITTQALLSLNGNQTYNFSGNLGQNKAQVFIEYSSGTVISSAPLN